MSGSVVDFQYDEFIDFVARRLTELLDRSIN